MRIRTCITGLLLLPLFGCAGKKDVQKEDSAAALNSWTPPHAGTIVAADSMPFSDNDPNHYFFSVRLRANGADPAASVDEMSYDVLAGYGPAQSQSTIMMPHGGADLKPLLRVDDSEKYGYIIGFIPGPDHGGDTTFQPYYKVVASRGEISIKAVKGYVFQ